MRLLLQVLEYTFSDKTEKATLVSDDHVVAMLETIALYIFVLQRCRHNYCRVGIPELDACPLFLDRSERSSPIDKRDSFSDPVGK